MAKSPIMFVVAMICFAGCGQKEVKATEVSGGSCGSYGSIVFSNIQARHEARIARREAIFGNIQARHEALFDNIQARREARITRREARGSCGSYGYAAPQEVSYQEYPVFTPSPNRVGLVRSTLVESSPSLFNKFRTEEIMTINPGSAYTKYERKIQVISL